MSVGSAVAELIGATVGAVTVRMGDGGGGMGTLRVTCATAGAVVPIETLMDEIASDMEHPRRLASCHGYQHL